MQQRLQSVATGQLGSFIVTIVSNTAVGRVCVNSPHTLSKFSCEPKTMRWKVYFEKLSSSLICKELLYLFHLYCKIKMFRLFNAHEKVSHRSARTLSDQSILLESFVHFP